MMFKIDKRNKKEYNAFKANLRLYATTKTDWGMAPQLQGTSK